MRDESSIVFFFFLRFFFICLCYRLSLDFIGIILVFLFPSLSLIEWETFFFCSSSFSIVLLSLFITTAVRADCNGFCLVYFVDNGNRHDETYSVVRRKRERWWWWLHIISSQDIHTHTHTKQTDAKRREEEKKSRESNAHIHAHTHTHIGH